MKPWKGNHHFDWQFDPLPSGRKYLKYFWFYLFYDFRSYILCRSRYSPYQVNQMPNSISGILTQSLCRFWKDEKKKTEQIKDLYFVSETLNLWFRLPDFQFHSAGTIVSSILFYLLVHFTPLVSVSHEIFNARIHWRFGIS